MSEHAKLSRFFTWTPRSREVGLHILLVHIELWYKYTFCRTCLATIRETDEHEAPTTCVGDTLPCNSKYVTPNRRECRQR